MRLPEDIRQENAAREESDRYDPFGNLYWTDPAWVHPDVMRSLKNDGTLDTIAARYAWTDFCWQVWKAVNWARAYDVLPDAIGGAADD